MDFSDYKTKAEDEIWRSCIEDPMYEVSSVGRVRGIERRVPNRSGSRLVAARMRVAQLNRFNGYLIVKLTNSRTYYVHRLVASAFCPGHFEGAVVNHLDGVKTNNRAHNLEWVTHQVNVQKAYEMGLLPPPPAPQRGALSSGARRVIGLRLDMTHVIHLDAICEAEALGFSPAAITTCAKGRSNSHRGYQWFYVDGANGREVAA